MAQITTDIGGRQPLCTVAGLQSNALTAASVPRFSRMLSCCQHVHSELHTAAAPSLDALSLREALTSVACDGSTAQLINEGAA